MINETKYQRELREQELNKANNALEVAKALENQRIKKGWKYMFLENNKVLVKPEMFNKKIELGYNFCK